MDKNMEEPETGTVAVIHPETQSGSIMDIIEKVALSGDETATSNIERLYEIQKDTLNREAQQAFNRDFAKAQMEMLGNPIIKDAWNDQTKSKYAKLEIIDRVIKPIYTGHGFGMIGGTQDSPLDNHIRITYDIIHIGGHSERGKFYDCPIDDKGIKGSVNKTGPHARGSSTTYGKRYLKCLIWDVITQDDDDGNMGAGSDPGSCEKWLIRLEENSDDPGKFWKVNGEKIKKECGKANASKIYKMVIEGTA